MTSNSTQLLRPTAIPASPRIGMVSLGCPKALVDSERILTRLKGEGYRAEMIDGASGGLGKRIGRAKREKVPYVLVVGDSDGPNGNP